MPVPSQAASFAINKAKKEGREEEEEQGVEGRSPVSFEFVICLKFHLKISSHRIFHFVTGKVIRFHNSLKRSFAKE